MSFDDFFKVVVGNSAGETLLNSFYLSISIGSSPGELVKTDDKMLVELKIPKRVQEIIKTLYDKAEPEDMSLAEFESFLVGDAFVHGVCLNVDKLKEAVINAKRSEENS